MSNTLDTNVELKRIKAPSLTSAEYGKDIREQFDNINENFRRVSNHDYIEGKSGANVNVVDLPLYENDQFTELGIQILNVLADTNLDLNDWNDTLNWTYEDWTQNTEITHYLDPVVYSTDINELMVCFYDYIKQNPTITVFYTLKDVEDETGDTNSDDSNRSYICSPQVYTFLDQRFSNIEENGGIGGTNKEQFEGLEDSSCLLTLKYENEIPIFTRSNIFPTIYYDKGDDQFKWKIYNNRSGIRAQGPKGDNGSSTSLWLAQVQATGAGQTGAQPATISKLAVMNPTNSSWEWVDITADIEKPKAGDCCIALSSSAYLASSDDSDDGFIDAYVSPVYLTSQGDNIVYWVILNQNNGINNNIHLNELVNTFGDIGDGALLGGIYLPHTANANPHLGVHFLYNTTTTSTTEVGSKHTLHVSSKLNSRGIDFSDPGSNEPDDNSNIDVEYTEIDLKSRNANINCKDDIGLTTSNGGNINASAGSNIDLSAVDEINISAGDGDVSISSSNESVNITSTNNQVNITAENRVNITSSDESVNIKANNEVNVTGDDNINIKTANESVNIEANTGINLKARTSCTGIVSAQVNGVSDVYLGCPIGTIVMWPGPRTDGAAGGEVPEGWLLCNGDLISIANSTTEAQRIQDHDFAQGELQALVNVIGYTFGTPGVEVRLPNLQQRFPLGAKEDDSWKCGNQTYNTNLGSTGGEKEHKLTGKEILHEHNLLDSYSGSAGLAYGPNTNDNPSIGIVENTQLAHNNTPLYLAINFIIKYK